MTQELLEKLSTKEKVELLLHAEDKLVIRKFCGITQSKLLMLELSHRNALKNFLKNRVEKMTDEEFHLKLKELVK